MLFTHPFDLAVGNRPNDCQMVLIEMQTDMNTRRGCSEDSLVDFYKLYVCVGFPNLSRHAGK